jgi:hypothetical protein
MGSKAKKQAEKMGLTKQRLTILYGRPKKFRMTFSKNVPDVADAIRDFINFRDPNLIHDRSGGFRSISFYYVSGQLYVEVLDKISGALAVNPGNHVIQVNIFCEDDEIIRGIANAINQIWDDGILAHIDWKKVEGKFKVKQEDCIAAWKQWLS